MKLKAVSGVMLTLFLVGMLTLAFDIQPVEASGTIKIAFCPSWGYIAHGDLIYTDLVNNWFLYGSYQLEFIDVDHPVTYEKLVATGATVVLLCDPAGGREQYTQSEADAIQSFLEAEGKGIFMSYLLNHRDYDDSMLAPLVGVDSGALDSGGISQNNAYDLYQPDHPIFAEVTDPWNSGGWPYSQSLLVPSWYDAILSGAQIVAETTDSLAVVITYDNPKWKGIWVTSMPDYNGNEMDKQFVYNSLVWLAPIELTVTSSPITGITFTINGTPKTTPYTEWLLEGSYTLEMPKTHNGYVWSHWLEDGDPNRVKTVTMDTDILLTAMYEPAPKPVGGISIPVNKLSLLAPYIGSTILLAVAVVTVGYIKKRKRNT